MCVDAGIQGSSFQQQFHTLRATLHAATVQGSPFHVVFGINVNPVRQMILVKCLSCESACKGISKVVHI